MKRQVWKSIRIAARWMTASALAATTVLISLGATPATVAGASVSPTPMTRRPAEAEGNRVSMAPAQQLTTLAITKTAVLPANPQPGDPVSYRIVLSHAGGANAAAQLADRLPDGMTFTGPVSVTALAGTVSPLSANFISGTVRWNGTLSPGARMRLSFQARIDPCIGGTKTITNVARAQRLEGVPITDSVAITVNCPPPPNVEVLKSVYALTGITPVVTSTLDVLPGDEIVFRFRLRNLGNQPAQVFLRDQLPPGLEFGGSGDPRELRATRAISPNTALVIDARARVTSECVAGRVITNVAQYAAVPGSLVGLNPPSGWPFTNTNTIALRLHCDDLGDAPDSTNHFGVAMAAYPAVPAAYPTVFDPATGAVQGPKHRVPFPFHLGARFSSEVDADVLPDQDGVRNIIPPANVPNKDGDDDGVLMSRIVFTDCRATTIPVQVYIGPNALAFFAAHGVGVQGYLNVWVDGNRDGDWADARQCTFPTGNLPAFEHIIIDQPISLPALGPGLHTLNVPTGLVPWPAGAANQPAWLRFTLSERPANKPLSLGVIQYGDGRGYGLAFATGETEDYLWRLVRQPDVAIRKRGAMRTDSGGPITTTASANDIVVWQIEYGNGGDAPANNVVITDDLTQAGNKAGLNITSVPPISYTLNGNSLTFNAGSLAPGARGHIMIELARHLAQHIYTNTVTITATNDADAGNNRAQAEVKHRFLQPPLILNPLDGTTCDGIFTGTRTLLGLTTEFATVDLYVDGVLTATLQAGGSGYFRHDMVLPDGVHTIYAVAHLNGHDSTGETRTVIVNSALTWDPLSLRFIDPVGRRYRPTDDDGRTDESGWEIHLGANKTYTASVRLCCQSPLASVTLNTGATIVPLLDLDGDSIFEGAFSTPISGTTLLSFALNVTCNGSTSSVPAEVLIDPDGVVYDSRTGAPLSNALVLCMVQDANGGTQDVTNATYSVWPAASFSQLNPQVTQANGYFAFFTPPGVYRLDVTRSGYQPYRSPDLRVVSEPVHHDVPLTPIVTEPARVTIVLNESGFEPSVIRVTRGAVIALINADIREHQAQGALAGATSEAAGAAQAGGFDSGALGPNQRYLIKFDTPGTYQVTDASDPNARAVIVVLGNTILLPVVRR